MTRRAVLMVIDGLRADMACEPYTPELAGIARRSRVFRRQRSVFPSATRVNSASIATGCWPASHGLAGNAIALDEGDGLRPVSVGPADFRDRLRRATGRTLHRPTLAERVRGHGGAVIYSNSSPGAAHMQDPDGHGRLFHRSGSFAPGLEPVTGDAHLEVTYDGAGDAITTERFCHALGAAGDERLFVLWVCEPDHSQHELELGSGAHRDVIAGSDRCARQVWNTVCERRAAGDDLLFVIASDHGHETIDAVVPVTEELMAAGFKASADSTDVVLASSGMGALVYLSEAARPRREAIAAWLAAQAWCGQVFAGEDLARVGQRSDTALAIAFSMAKTDAPNRFGVPGLGHVAGDQFMRTDAVGLGQHGGLGPYETNALLMINGGGFETGVTDHESRAIDIAPTILRHLGLPSSDMDGSALPARG